jgi:hypothetical protein
MQAAVEGVTFVEQLRRRASIQIPERSAGSNRASDIFLGRVQKMFLFKSNIINHFV